jgi:hypothetical protein
MVGMLAAANNGVNAPKQVCREVFSSGAVEQAGSFCRDAQKTAFCGACYMAFFEQGMERMQEIQVDIP